MKIAAALVEARKSAGLTQKDVAEALGVGVTYVSDMENGRRSFGEHYLPALPKAMREHVARAMVAEHRDAISRIQSGAE